MAWHPSPEDLAECNAAGLMRELGLESYAAFQAWSAANRETFWARTIELLGIHLRRSYDTILDASAGVESPRWLSGARLNIAESCFAAAPESPAIVHQRKDGLIETLSLVELDRLSNRVANGLMERGFNAGDAIAIDMPMNVEAVAAYLGIVKMGGVVVSIADSFAPPEIATRLRLGDAVAVFTQDVIRHGGKEIALYERVKAASAPAAIVVSVAQDDLSLRDGDIGWNQFLAADDGFEAVACDPQTHLNILFSSGTTGDPKAIPWTHVSPIKCVADAFYMHDVRPGEILAWPTNLGWMMGPWLIFAALVNRASMAIFDGAPTGRDFGRFVQDAGVTMLGVVPSLVNTWRASQCMENLDWSRIRRFSSTGECSNADDMHYLMSLAGGRPVIEYCGGTEVAGGYIGCTLMRPCSPATFNTLAPGLDAVIMDDAGAPATTGELFLVPPSIGFSTTLINGDHHEVYYAETPRGPGGAVLRRHGDLVEQLPDGFYRAHGRIDDTMNLGGIKVGSADIERVLNELPAVSETAAIAVSPPGGGPSRLVIYAVPAHGADADASGLRESMQALVRRDLNPLFKIHDLRLIDALPRTASNKVMRRVLRDRYAAHALGRIDC